MLGAKIRSAEFKSLLGLDKTTVSSVILVTLVALQLLLYWRYVYSFRHVLFQSIFVMGLFWQVYQKQRQVQTCRDLPGNLLGIALILFLLFRAKYIFLVEASVFWYFLAWLTLIGYVLLIAGLPGINQFRREILFSILITLLPKLFAFISYVFSQVEFISITVISAKLTSLLLWYIGFDPITQGQIVYVNGGAIDIHYGCTAIPLLIRLFSLALLTTLIFPNLCPRRSLTFILPFILSLGLSIIRLAIMVLVVKDADAFDFWHGLQGGNLFTTLAMVMFFGIILLMAPPQNASIANPVSEQFQPQTPLWLLRSSGVVLLLILLNFMVGSPVAGANTIADYKLPTSINLPHWQLKNTTVQPLVSTVAGEDGENHDQGGQTPIQGNSDFPLDQRSYLYQRGKHSLILNLRYVINTLGDVKSYYSTVFEGLPQIDDAIEIKEADNYRLEFSNVDRQYVTACLNVKGKTMVSEAQFVTDFRQDYAKPLKLLDWLLGKRLLQDRRCLWIELSTPKLSVSYSEMIETWQFLIDYWRSSFPPFRT
jgi:cyanosortase A-associated protein